MSISKLSTSASLKQVMDKFEEISLQDFFAIDIVVKNELPSVVKDNQIVVIGDSTGKIYIDNKHIDNIVLGNNDVYVKYGYEVDGSHIFDKTSGNKNIKLYVLSVYKCLDGAIVPAEEVYVGSNNKWVQILKDRLSIFRDGEYVFGEYTSNDLTMIKKAEANNYPTDTFVKILPASNASNPNTLYFAVSPTSYHKAGDVMFCSTEPVDFGRFSKLIVKINSYNLGGNMVLSVGGADEALRGNLVSYSLSKGTGETMDIELDVSSINTTEYIKLYTNSVGSVKYKLYISEMYLTI